MNGTEHCRLPPWFPLKNISVLPLDPISLKLSHWPVVVNGHLHGHCSSISREGVVPHIALTTHGWARALAEGYAIACWTGSRRTPLICAIKSVRSTSCRRTIYAAATPTP